MKFEAEGFSLVWLRALRDLSQRRPARWANRIAATRNHNQNDLRSHL